MPAKVPGGQKKDNTLFDHSSESLESRSDFLDTVEHIIKNDTTFFRAFRNLRFASYQFSNDLFFRAKDSLSDGIYQSKNLQKYKDSCRSMFILEELANKHFFDNGEYIFQTAKLYDSLFYTHKMICGEPRFLPMVPGNAKKSIKDHYTDQLKILIFSPGIEIDIPIVGKRTAIFNQEIKEKYYFEISEMNYCDSISCYRFTADPKDNLSSSARDKLVIKSLETLISKESNQIVSRKYHIKYDSWLFDCDVQMAINLQKIEHDYFPAKIEYDGSWNAFGLPRETGKFTINFYEFKL